MLFLHAVEDLKFWVRLVWIPFICFWYYVWMQVLSSIDIVVYKRWTGLFNYTLQLNVYEVVWGAYSAHIIIILFCLPNFNICCDCKKNFSGLRIYDVFKAYIRRYINIHYDKGLIIICIRYLVRLTSQRYITGPIFLVYRFSTIHYHRKKEN